MIEREFFRRKFDEGRKTVHADLENDGNEFGKEEILKKKEMGVSTSKRLIFCGD